MIVDVVLRGAQASQHLPLAWAYLHQLHNADPKQWRTLQLLVDGYDLQIRHTPGKQFIKITGQGAYFEFFTSGKPVGNITETQDGVSFQAYNTATIGTAITASGPAGSRVVSTAPQILKGARFPNTAQASAIQRQAQVDLANEPQCPATPGATKQPSSFPRILYESWAPMHSHTGVHLRSYNTVTSTNGASSNLDRDFVFDVPWMDSRSKNPVRSAYVQGAADWPRASGVQKVINPKYGTREFAVYVDASSQFWVFPTSQITATSGTAQNVDPKYVKGSAPAFPAWAFHASSRFRDQFAAGLTPSQMLESPEIDWQLHPDGTKACAVVYKRLPVAPDTPYLTALPSGAPLTDYANTLASAGWGAGTVTPPPGDTARYLLSTGLLENTIVITLTGPNDEDFTLAGATTVLRDPETTPYATLLAGYTWFDIPDPFNTDPTILTASRGDLCVVDLELRYDPTQLLPVYGASLWVKDLTRGTDVTALAGSTALIDFDMRTLSFAVQFATNEQITDTVPLRAGYPPPGFHQPLPAMQSVIFSIGHPQVAVFTFGKFRTLLYPPGMPTTQLLALTPLAPAAQRATEVARVLIPLSEASTWTDHPDLRTYLAVQAGYSSAAYTLTTAEQTWWNTVTPGGGQDTFYLQTPRFGVYAYSWWINRIMQKSPRSILFAHPNGSWGYFDCSAIYNKNGTRRPMSHYDTLARFDASKLSMALFDQLHFELAGATPLDTSFIAMYNAALTGSTGANALVDTFQTLSAADFLPTFTKGQFNYIIPSGVDIGVAISWLELKVQWGGGAAYYLHDGQYQSGGNLIAGSVPGLEVYSDVSPEGGTSGNLFTQRLDTAAYTVPGYSGTVVVPIEEHARIAMASPVLIVS